MEKTKPYFAKYLQGEGEIKDGDIVLLGNTLTKVVGIDEDMSLKAQELTGLKTRREWYQQKSVIQKLFLCSRDIQVGDKFNYRGTTHNILQYIDDSTKCLYNQNGEKLEPQSCYKVICEISPAATWLKDGINFEENEVVLVAIPITGETGSEREYRHLFTGVLSKDKWKGLAKIKCSQCNTYH